MISQFLLIPGRHEKCTSDIFSSADAQLMLEPIGISYHPFLSEMVAVSF
jgi:hypothetical protein